MTKFFQVAALMMILSPSYAEIYTWIDSQGVVHFSDNPHQGAEKLKLPAGQSYSALSLPSSVPEEDGSATHEANKSSETSDSDKPYTKIAIREPLHGATIRNNQGYILVSVELEPKLSEGDNL
ncbi:hypothetical protein TUM19329_16670 [Legionella antarctica]|uniref:DUF4124 domain-containing protein n=1 Tax=Legionella antarctica TaxID=2708020 RepID=A0A6F8T5R4_9GAMM|nr:DUF4124 domain-containing protein [Legionella antarctica]BCA95306.1 hypothetical protein TUM19329_16670 [Legionella antarctica]